LSGQWEAISGHGRLLRSLNFNDDDYSGNVLSVLRTIADNDEEALDVIEQYVSERFGGDADYISAKPAPRRITFAPNVFTIPDCAPESDLAAVMMPFSAGFKPVYEAIHGACKRADLRCQRVDDIWEESIIIQDIFNLIFRAHVVIADFTGKNPNVMYETGIAHTLGRHVVPISQAVADVPFDLQHHRVLTYLDNHQGRAELEEKLATRLQQLTK
jgi:hypothetical protein